MFSLFKNEKEKHSETTKTKILKSLAIVLPALVLVVGFGGIDSFAAVTIEVPAIPDGLFDGILTALNGYISAVLPFGLKVMGTFIAVGFIPRLIYKFI